MLDRFFNAFIIYSIKPLAGHCLGAAAAVEVAVTLLANQRGEIPAPHIADETGAHPQLLDGLTPATKGITVKSSLGTGGHNAVLVLVRWVATPCRGGSLSRPSTRPPRSPRVITEAAASGNMWVPSRPIRVQREAFAV